MSQTRQETCNATVGAALSPGRRALGVGLTWALIGLAQPGVFCPDGFGLLGFVALVPWALVASQPGRRAKLVEWLVGAVGLIGMFWWMRHLLPYLLPAMGLVPAIWLVVGGSALRRLVRRYPLALAVPLAWTLAEMLRWMLPPPLSFGWWRLGFLSHDSLWLSGSARVWGTWGLTWVFAAFAGYAADWIRARGNPRPISHILGLAPLVIAVFLSALVEAPKTRPGPNLLIVTPGMEWGLAATSDDHLHDFWIDPMTLTLEGLAAAKSPIDLVCWGESLGVGRVLLPGVLEAFDQGVRGPEWGGAPWGPDCDPESVRSLLVWEDWTAQSLMGDAPMGVKPLLEGLRGFELREVPFLEQLRSGERLLPEGTSLFSGMTALTVHDENLRRINGAAIWGSDGQRRGLAGKVHLVPAAEDASVAAKIPFAVSIMNSVGGFIPDFVAAEDFGVLPFQGQAGETYRAAVAVCYDNVFDDTFWRPQQAGDVDLFLVPSNESWYRGSVEFDHMVAFSRLAAIQSGRSIARATLSGISCVMGPDGRMVDLQEDGGRIKQVRGCLESRVPIPADPASRTPWARSARWQPWILGLLIGFLLLLTRCSVTPTGATVRTAERASYRESGTP
jgi:apolipoprotein N-acyltransferase